MRLLFVFSRVPSVMNMPNSKDNSHIESRIHYLSQIVTVTSVTLLVLI